MAINNTYARLLIDNYIKEKLSSGVPLSASDINDELTTLLESTDLSVPQFAATNYQVEKFEAASATKHNNTFLDVKNDLRALYKEMILLAKTSNENIERWDIESTILEKRLIDLEERIENLLLLTENTEGYHSVIVDNFSDRLLVDQVNSTVDVDLTTQSVKMGSNNTTTTRIFLNELNPNKDIVFKIRNSTNLLSRNDMPDSEVSYPFLQSSRVWWTSVLMKEKTPVTCELTVKLSEDPIDVSRINIDLLDSVEASPVFITPLYSTDNISFTQLPTILFTQEVRTSAAFTFKTVQAKYIKFLMTKRANDASSSTNAVSSYQFGFKNISFFSEGFDPDSIQTLYTKPLSILDVDGNVKSFEKLALETCERLETDTKIKYYITASNDSSVPLGSAIWNYIEPVQRSEYLAPTVLNIGSNTEVVYEDILLSYDKDGAAGFIKPASDFKLLSSNVSNVVISSDESSTSTARYNFLNEEDFILNYQIKDSSYSGSGTNAIELGEDINVFRNVGEKGLSPSNEDDLVRDVLRGWKFEDPYYVTTIEVENADGITIDVGDSPIIIDGQSYKNKVDNTVLTGKGDVTTGIHVIKVHKNNWRHVETGKDTLAELKAADPLYPYNHKLLIEGYSYGGSYPSTTEKVYTGVDLFAERLMKEVSVFDFINNIRSNDYSRMALDRDAPESHDAGNDPTIVFLVKANNENPDFINEKFVVKFKQINQYYNYFRLRADFETEDQEVTPELLSYKVKLG